MEDKKLQGKGINALNVSVWCIIPDVNVWVTEIPRQSRSIIRSTGVYPCVRIMRSINRAFCHGHPDGYALIRFLFH